MKKTAFLSNVNIDPLRHRFENAGQYKICFSGYNQWQAEMLDDNSQLNQFCPDYVFIYLNCDEKNFNINDLYYPYFLFFAGSLVSSLILLLIVKILKK